MTLMGKKRPAKDAREGESRKETGNIRAPAEIVEMLEAIAQHGLNGWTKVPHILRDPQCPLRAWLLPLYQRVVSEKGRRAEQFKQD